MEAMKRPLILLLNGALLLGALALLGRTAATAASGWLGEESAPPVAAAAPAAGGAPRQWDDRQVILTRNLFNASTLAPAAQKELEEQQRYEKTRLPLRLLGTAAAGDPALSWAAVEDLESRKHLVARVNDRLKGQATVLRIERGRIVLENAGRREELALETPEGALGGASARSPSLSRSARALPPPSAGGVGAAVQRLAENRFAVPRAEVENAAANPSALFSQARILPKYDQGRMVGVQLNAIRPGSLFDQVGIQDGDTVSQVNGIAVSSPEDSARILEQFAAGGSLRVTVTGRDGQVRELDYEVQ